MAYPWDKDELLKSFERYDGKSFLSVLGTFKMMAESQHLGYGRMDVDNLLEIHEEAIHRGFLTDRELTLAKSMMEKYLGSLAAFINKHIENSLLSEEEK